VSTHYNGADLCRIDCHAFATQADCDKFVQSPDTSAPPSCVWRNDLLTGEKGTELSGRCVVNCAGVTDKATCGGRNGCIWDAGACTSCDTFQAGCSACSRDCNDPHIVHCDGCRTRGFGGETDATGCETTSGSGIYRDAYKCHVAEPCVQGCVECKTRSGSCGACGAPVQGQPPRYFDPVAQTCSQTCSPGYYYLWDISNGTDRLICQPDFDGNGQCGVGETPESTADCRN
jgi:hypothetical protein